MGTLSTAQMVWHGIPICYACQGVHSAGDGDQEVLEDVLAVPVSVELLGLVCDWHAPPLTAPPVQQNLCCVLDRFLAHLLQICLLMLSLLFAVTDSEKVVKSGLSSLNTTYWIRDYSSTCLCSPADRLKLYDPCLSARLPVCLSVLAVILIVSQGYVTLHGAHRYSFAELSESCTFVGMEYLDW